MRISVCIPVYNAAPYIERCARSLFEQTHSDIEYLFVDDCSTDDGVPVLERIVAEYPARKGSVRVIRLAKNSGASVARKTAIRQATGDILAFCDADDWLDKGLYEAMVHRLVDAGADVALCSIRRWRNGGETLCACPDNLAASGIEALRDMDRLPGLYTFMTKIFRRSCVDLEDIEWPDDLNLAEDVCFSAQVLAKAKLVVGVPEVCYRYCANEGSLSRQRDFGRIVSCHKRVYEILTRRLPSSGGVPVRRYLTRMILFWGVVSGMLSSNEYSEWRQRLLELGGTLDFSDRSLWGQRLMKMAERAVVLSRIASPWVRTKVTDVL